jgi:hypothetical protein
MGGRQPPPLETAISFNDMKTVSGLSQESRHTSASSEFCHHRPVAVKTARAAMIGNRRRQSVRSSVTAPR